MQTALEGAVYTPARRAAPCDVEGDGDVGRGVARVAVARGATARPRGVGRGTATSVCLFLLQTRWLSYTRASSVVTRIERARCRRGLL